jgi:outer membrane protein assembly factor BamB
MVGEPPAANTWSGFRNGGESRSEAQRLPLHWSPEEGVAWQRELVGYGQSSPVVWGQTVFVTAVVGPMKEKCVVMAFDSCSGEPRWQQHFDAGTTKASNYMTSRAAPTPVVDANGVYGFFESGDLLGLSHQGQVKWRRSLTQEYGEFQNGHGLGSSAAQTADAVIVLIDHSGPSYLLAVDKRTGENRWKADRESRYSWTSPIVVSWQGTEQVVVSSNGFVDGYDAATGERVWSLDGIGGNTIPSPSASGDRLFIGAAISEFAPSSGETRSSCCLGLRDNGGRPACEVLWRAEKAFSYYASPLPYRDCVYHVNKVGAVSCLDARTGVPHYVERIDGPCWATPVAVGDHVYFFGKNGVTTVLEAGAEFSKVAANALWDVKNPPKPETYTEHRPARPEGERASFTDSLASSDANGDGKLAKEELPKAMQGFFDRLDRNSDGIVDQEELAAIRERSGRRREGGEGRLGGSYGDPTVYGVAAAGDSFFVRSGTRLYCIRGSADYEETSEK